MFAARKLRKSLVLRGRVLCGKNRDTSQRSRSTLLRHRTSRCYEVSTDIGDDTPYQDVSPTPDDTGRKTEDGVVYSMTIFDWLAGGKREDLKTRVSESGQGH